MTHAKRVLTLFLSGALLCAAPARAVVNEYQTLDLVRTYASEAEVQAAYPDLFPTQTINDDGKTINFYDQHSRSLIKQLQKKSPEVLREENTENDTIIWEKSYHYQISDDHAFLIETEWESGRLKSGIADPAELRGTPTKCILYNSIGESIAQLDPYMNIVSLSPDKQHFLVMGADEEIFPFVYLYAIDGTLLKTFEFEGAGSASFSENGEFIEARSQKQFFIFSKTGKQLYETVYSDLGGNSTVYGIFVSPDGASFLVSLSGKLRLLSLSNQLLWEIESPEVLSCYFDKEKNTLQLLTLSENQGTAQHDIYQVDIRAIETGKLLDRIEGVSQQTQFRNGTIFIHQGGTFYEYLQK